MRNKIYPLYDIFLKNVTGSVTFSQECALYVDAIFSTGEDIVPGAAGGGVASANPVQGMTDRAKFTSLTGRMHRAHPGRTPC